MTTTTLPPAPALTVATRSRWRRATSARSSCSARHLSRSTSLDDSFLQPPAGTSAVDHLAGGLVPVALLAAAAWAYGRVRAGMARPCWRWSLACSASASALIEAGYYTTAVGPSGDDFTGLLAIPAGVLLVGLGAVTLVALAAPRPEHALDASSAARCSSSPRSWRRSSSLSRCCSPMPSRTSSGRTCPPTRSASRTRTSASRPPTGCACRAGTSRRATARRSSTSRVGSAPRRPRGCWPGTATASCCSTAAERAAARAAETCSAGAATRTSSPRSTG